MQAAADLVDEKRIRKDFETILEISKDQQGGVTRLAYTEKETKGHRHIASEAEKIGLHAKIDEAGNLYVRLGQENASAIRIG